MPIVIDHLTHTYYDGATSVSAVKDVCLEIREGEFLSIIGHTGCGKTTLVQHLNGLLLPSSGRVLVCLPNEVEIRVVSQENEVDFVVG